MEALAALLGRAVVHVLGDADPIVRALLTHQLKEQLVFFGDPGSTTMRGSHDEGEKSELERRWGGVSGT